VNTGRKSIYHAARGNVILNLLFYINCCKSAVSQTSEPSKYLVIDRAVVVADFQAMCCKLTQARVLFKVFRDTSIVQYEFCASLVHGLLTNWLLIIVDSLNSVDLI